MCDGSPAWQNSVEAVRRSSGMKRILGAFDRERCVGYIVVSSKFGRVAQLAVDRDYRRRGIGSQLLHAMEADTAAGFSLQIINVDTAIAGTAEFFASKGFYERLSQFEMSRQL
jgi:N-acetylglutamate synthase-like GNAT family acetyltransferase